MNQEDGSGNVRLNERLGVFRTRYRIVTDAYAGFEIQFRYWWMPFWMQLDIINTYSTLEAAEDHIKRRTHKKVVVKVCV